MASPCTGWRGSGKTVEREPRLVEVGEIRLLDWTPPFLIVEVICSPGTYIRSLAHDLGQHLGAGAYLATLVRMASGRFTLEEAVSLERLEEAFEHGQEDRYLVSLDEALLDWPAMIISADDARRVVHGQAIAGDPPAAEDGDLRRAYSVDGDFVAILRYHASSGQWCPKKVFAS